MSSQLQITGETKVKSLTGVLVGTSGVVSSLNIDGPLGIPQLDVNGKILVAQLPNSVMEYKGTWNAATNTPTLVNGTGNQGDVYLCNVAGTVNFGAGAIAFVVGDQVIYSGTIWQRASGATGTVTSVALTESGDSLNITGSPITTSGTINIGFNGTNLQYVNGAGNLTTFPTLISSIGLTMPTAFNVANSPLTANGTIAVTGAGIASQYIRGDGTLATFPSNAGGGSSVNYYLNGSVNASVATYKQMDYNAIIGGGTDFTLTGNGLIAQFLTDVGNPNRVQIPSGAWNFEMYFNSSSNGGAEGFYVELFKYDGTTFTLIATSSATPESITSGTTIDLYVTSLAVPTTALLTTDRLAVRVYIVNNGGGRTITLHTENNTLCEIITTFAGGIASLNGLTANTQYLATGTSGTDFNIASSVDTHTFNLPVASATNTGKLSSTDWSTFNAKQPAGNYVTLDTTQTITAAKTFTNNTIFSASPLFDQSANYKVGASLVGTGNYIGMAFDKSGTGSSSTLSMKLADGTSVKAINLDFVGSPATYTYTFPAANGTIALLQSTQTFSGSNTFSGFASFTSTSGTSLQYGAVIQKGFTPLVFGSNITNIYSDATTNNIVIRDNSSIAKLEFNNSTQTYTFPAATGTLALGTGTTNYHAKWTGTNTIGNSLIWDNGTNVGIGNTNTSYTLDVTGTGYFSGALTGGSTAAFVGNVTAGDSGGGQVFRTANAGTSSVGIRLTNTGGNSFIGLSNSGGTGYLSGSAYALNIQTEGARDLQLGTNNATRMTITSAGNVGIGSSPSSILQIGTGGGGATTRTTLQYSNGGYSATNLPSAPSSYSDGDKLIFWDDGSGKSSIGIGNAYNMIIQSTGASNAAIQFFTGTSGAGTERMRITSGGQVQIKQAGNTFSDGIRIINTANNTWTTLAGGDNDYYFGYNGNAAAKINSAGTYTAFSDRNRKKDFEESNIGLDAILGLKPTLYRIKTDDENADKQLGFIAQEVKDFIPQAYSESINGDETFIGLNYNAIVTVLVKAIQEQTQIIKDLEARIVSLESK